MAKMTLDVLKMLLSKYGTIRMCKEGTVFTLLMTGEKLDNWNAVNEIQSDVLAYAGDKYPVIEAMSNDASFFCIVLKPKN